MFLDGQHAVEVDERRLPDHSGEAGLDIRPVLDAAKDLRMLWITLYQSFEGVTDISSKGSASPNEREHALVVLFHFLRTFGLDRFPSKRVTRLGPFDRSWRLGTGYPFAPSLQRLCALACVFMHASSELFFATDFRRVKGGLV